MLVSESYFYGVQVFALYVFDERHFHDVLIVCSADIGGDAGQSGKLRSAETTLAGDNLVFVVAKLAQGDGCMMPISEMESANSCNATGRIHDGAGWD